LIIGDGDIKTDLMNYIHQKGLTYSLDGKDDAPFIFTSWIREVDKALPGLDLVALSSKNEGTPVSLIEAQAAAKFIIATNVGGTKDILHPDCGLLCEADDHETYKKNMLYAVNHFELVNAKANAASEEIISKFGYPRLCADMDKLYEELLTDKKPK
jgi:glycosyltransferase involved in cell wall biosynthesis